MHKAWKMALSCRDPKKSEKFYTEVLGLQVRERFPTPDGDYVFMDAGGFTVETMPEAGLKKGMEESWCTRPGINHLSFRVDDILAAVADLKRKGVKFLKEPFDATEEIRLAFFEGPDGELLQLFQRTPKR